MESPNEPFENFTSEIPVPNLLVEPSTSNTVNQSDDSNETQYKDTAVEDVSVEDEEQKLKECRARIKQDFIDLGLYKEADKVRYQKRRAIQKQLCPNPEENEHLAQTFLDIVYGVDEPDEPDEPVPLGLNNDGEASIDMTVSPITPLADDDLNDVMTPLAKDSLED